MFLNLYHIFPPAAFSNPSTHVHINPQGGYRAKYHSVPLQPPPAVSIIISIHCVDIYIKYHVPVQGVAFYYK